MHFKRLLAKRAIVIVLVSMACSNDYVAKTEHNDPSTPCNCAETFGELVLKLEENYIGLALLSDVEYITYDSVKAEYGSLAPSMGDSMCTSFLGDFLSFFEDGHLFVSEYPKQDSTSFTKNKMFLQNEKKRVDVINRMLTESLDPISGTWSDGESKYKVIQNQNYFDAYLITSKRGDVEIGSLKFRLIKKGEKYYGTYYSFDFSDRYVKGSLYKEDQVLSLGTVKWVRIRDDNETIERINLPTIKELEEGNMLLSIPSFSIDFKAFQSFLKDNKKLLKEANHLIIDIRGNTGGNTIYFPLIKYFGTRTLQSRQGYVLTSDDNRAYFERLMGYGSSKIYSPLLARMTKNGTIVDGPNYPDRNFNDPKNNIEKVSILIDNGSASAAESFILHAKGASEKVVTFGSPSRGMIDFTSVNLLLLKNSGRRNIYFGYPTGTLHKDIVENGYNQTGILPDVDISSSEDKVQSILDYYN